MDEVQSPPPLSYATPTVPPAKDFLQSRIIVIDVVIIYALTFIGGFVVGLMSATTGDAAKLALAAAAINLAMGTLGFVLSGLRAPRGNRWPHLLLVALGVWLVSLINVVFGMSVLAWAFSAILIAATMAVGGAISMAVRR